MATVIWLGSPDGPEVGDFAGKSFPKGEAVEVDDNWGPLEKVSKNPYFKVEGRSLPAAKHDEPVTYRPPSETPVAGEVPKAGDPVVREKLQTAPPKEAKESEDEPEDKEHHPAVKAAIRSSRGR